MCQIWPRRVGLVEARLRLAEAEGRQEAAVAELRAILTVREGAVRSTRERQSFGVSTQDELHGALIAALETKVRLAQALDA